MTNKTFWCSGELWVNLNYPVWAAMLAEDPDTEFDVPEPEDIEDSPHYPDGFIYDCCDDKPDDEIRGCSWGQHVPPRSSRRRTRY